MSEIQCPLAAIISHLGVCKFERLLLMQDKSTNKSVCVCVFARQPTKEGSSHHHQ